MFNFDNKLGQDTREVIAFRTERTDAGNSCQYLEIQTSTPQEERESTKLDVASSVSNISRILMDEEGEEYSRYSAEGEIEEFSNGAVLLARLANQAEVVGSAGLEAMEELLVGHKKRIKALQDRKANLKQRLIEED